MDEANERAPDNGDAEDQDDIPTAGETLGEMVRYLQHMLADSGTRLTPIGEVQVDISKDVEIARAVDGVISQLGVPDLWPAVLSSWLAGGPGPFESPALKIPKKLNQGMPKMLARADATLRSHDRKIAKKRDELEEAEASRASFVTEMSAFRFFVVERYLVERLAGIFGMGPAWTIMRSLSAHFPAELADETRKNLEDSDAEKELAERRAARERETNGMFETLDFFSGDLPFEEAIRKAVLDVCRQHHKKKKELENAGRRPRSLHARATRINPKGRKESTEILESYKKAS